MLAFNAEGPAGLIDGKAPGQPAKLSDAQRQALAEVVEKGPDPERDGVVRWPRNDLAAWLHARFRVSLDETTVRRELRKLGFAKMSARPRHYAQDPAALVSFKEGAARRGGGDPRQAQVGHGGRAVVGR